MQGMNITVSAAVEVWLDKDVFTITKPLAQGAQMRADTAKPGVGDESGVHVSLADKESLPRETVARERAKSPSLLNDRSRRSGVAGERMGEFWVVGTHGEE